MRPMLILFALAVLLLPYAASGQKAAPLDVFAGDKRLDKKVAIRCEGLPIRDLLRLLREKTGIPLLVEDEMAMEKVIVFSPARPLRETLLDLAVLLNAQWRERMDKNSRTPYLLYRTHRQKDYENGFDEREAETILTFFDNQVKALDMQPDAIAKFRYSELIKRNLATSAGRVATQFYATLTPAEKRALIEVKHTPTFFYSELPEDSKKVLHEQFDQLLASQKAAAEKFAEERRIEGRDPNVSLGTDSAESIESRPVRLIKDSGTIYLSIGWMTHLVMNDITFWESREGDWDANPYTQKEVSDSVVLPEVAQISRAQKERHWIDRLRVLAASSKRPIAADWFSASGNLSNNSYDTADTPPAKKAMNTLAASHNVHWWLNGDTILFRHRRWFELRKREVPETWLRETLKSLHSHKDIPALIDVLRLRELTSAQIDGLALYYGGGISTHYELSEMLTILQKCPLDRNRPLRPYEDDAATVQEGDLPCDTLLKTNYDLCMEYIRNCDNPAKSIPAGAILVIKYSYPYDLPKAMRDEQEQMREAWQKKGWGGDATEEERKAYDLQQEEYNKKLFALMNEDRIRQQRGLPRLMVKQDAYVNIGVWMRMPAPRTPFGNGLTLSLPLRIFDDRSKETEITIEP